MADNPALNPSNNKSTRIFKNFGLLLGGRAGAAIFNVVAIAIMARVLGTANFGLVILVHTYIFIINGIISTKSFEAIVRYGLPARMNDDQSALKNLFSSSFSMDVIAAVLSYFVAIIAAPTIGHLLASDGAFTQWMPWYALVLLAAGTSTAKGVLRLYDRFGSLGIQLGFGPFIRCIGVLIAWWMEADVAGFLIAWGAGYVAENLLLHCLAYRELRLQLKGSMWQRPHLAKLIHEHNDFWHFMRVTYLQGVLDLLPKQVATMLAGIFLGTSAAGLFRIARELATVVSKPALLLRQAVFTDLTRLWTQQDPSFRSITFKTAALSGGAGMVLALLAIPFGGLLLGLLFGEEYIPAHSLLVLLLISASLELATSSLHMAAYAMNKAGRIVIINVTAMLIYLASFSSLTPIFGLIATGWAACATASVALIGAYFLVYRSK